MQDYQNRDYVLGSVDERVFDAMNDSTGGIFMMYSGCIDALEILPAGSMVSVIEGYHDMSVIFRGVSAAERKATDDFMNSLDS